MSTTKPTDLASRQKDEDKFVNMSSSYENQKHNTGQIIFERKLFQLSKQIVSISDLREVGITGLNMPSNSVERHIKNFPNRLTSAAYSLLREWCFQQPDLETARNNIIQALKVARKNFWIYIVLSEE